ncbi:MAG: hypothetical protein MZV64_71665 [Ignavibacteriales bacterium]|nr:hypothetical protein [Ignavibacteriales bacterium]
MARLITLFRQLGVMHGEMKSFSTSVTQQESGILISAIFPFRVKPSPFAGCYFSILYAKSTN